MGPPVLGAMPWSYRHIAGPPVRGDRVTPGWAPRPATIRPVLRADVGGGSRGVLVEHRIYPGGYAIHPWGYSIGVLPADPEEHFMELDPSDMTAVINRLKRAQGQLGAVARMLEEGADCKDVVTQ